MEIKAATGKVPSKIIPPCPGHPELPACHLLQSIGAQSNRLSRQFHKTLEQLRGIQAERRQREKRDLK
jgi:hypothetical protein